MPDLPMVIYSNNPTGQQRTKLNWPNRISLLRIFGVAPFVVLLLNQQAWPFARHAALGVFAVMAASDALDGYLARKTGQTTPLGRILDPLADKLLITCSVILLATRRASVPGMKLPDWVVVSVVGKDLWVVVGFVLLFMLTGQLRVHPTRVGKACTLGQLAMVIGVLLAPDIDRLVDGLGGWIAVALGWVVMALCALAVVSYTRLGLAILGQHEHGSP